MTANNSEDLVINVAEACKLLKLSRGAVYSGIKCGQIPAIRIGRRIIIPRSALSKMLEEAGTIKARSENQLSASG